MAIELSWLLVGTGDIARKRVAPALRDAASSRIAAVCDRDGDRAAAFAHDFGVKTAFTDYRSALDSGDCNAVYLATPVALHIPMALDALSAGKHVLVEKPLGLSYPDTLPALEAEKSASAASGCAYYRRFYPAYRMVRDMLEKGEFGKVVHVRMTYFSWFDPGPDDPKRWRVVHSLSGGGPLADMGTHMFDVLIGLFGLPERVSAMTATLDRQWDVEDSSGMVMRLGGGALATAAIHWNSKTWSHEFEIVGSECRVLWRPYDSGKVFRTIGRETTELDLPPAANVHTPLVEDFVEAALAGGKPAVTLAEGAKTNRLLDGVYRSSSEHREVAV
jgi:predicted dehydrogenase